MNSRRNFLKAATGTAAILLAPAVMAKPAQPNPNQPGERVLRLQNLHTGESIKATYWAEDQYLAEEMAALNRVLRDHRSNETYTMDQRLFDMLYVLQQQLASNGTYHVISGYRSPASNAKLHKNSSGVAKRSLHMQGRAIDIRLPGVELKHLRQAALDLKAGGVGYYPKSGFIHVDTGRTRFW
ncbi:MAG: DUF882 domain-containing protein [Halobacteria archaeon]|nr:DUF882 domain-containing protein [Halobacteria archaeon]